MARIKAKGLIAGEHIIIECVQHDNYIQVYKNGEEDLMTKIDIAVLIAKENEQLHNDILDGEISPVALESYLLILREKIFDEPPEIETEGVNDSMSSLTEEQMRRVMF